jgi:electron transport complex protein RnfC
MKDMKTYPRGGIHPPEYKEYTHSIPIKNALIPAIAVIPMHQHLGKPAECVVNPGDVLKEGMLIGKSTGYFSANVHTSIPGVVSGITDIHLPIGIKSKAVTIELQGEFDRSGKELKKSDWQALSKEMLIDKIQELGIVGLGGATFPTHIKYTIKEDIKLDYFVVNGVECEPFLTGDHRLMLEKTEEIIEGIGVVRRILSPAKVAIGIEENKPDAIAMMNRVIASLKQDIEVVPLKIKYPQGDEKMLLKAVTGREVPSGKLPFDVGAVVSNVGTVHAIYEAIVFDKPLTERVVTITGRIVKNPANLKVRIGTKIGELIDDCGGFTEAPERVIAGGPMMGFAVYDLDMPVTKGVSGIVVLSKREIRDAAITNCIQCGKCVSACPLGLAPTTLHKYIEHTRYEDAKAEGLLDCKECGCCAFTCPAHIPLVQSMKLGKLMLKKKVS